MDVCLSVATWRAKLGAHVGEPSKWIFLIQLEVGEDASKIFNKMIMLIIK